MPYTEYHQITKERNETLNARYKAFTEASGDVNTKPVRVFDPLSPKHIEELNLIRELSVQLQKKKEDDLKKAAQAAAEAEAEAKAAEEAAKAAEAAKEEKKEEKEDN